MPVSWLRRKSFDDDAAGGCLTDGLKIFPSLARSPLRPWRGGVVRRICAAIKAADRLQTRSDISASPSAAGGKFSHERRAQLARSGATVLCKEGHQCSQGLEISAINDGPTVPFRSDQPGAGQDREVSRHRVLRDVKKSSDLTGRDAIGFGAHQQPEGVETSALREGGKRRNRRLDIHTSKIVDIRCGTIDFRSAGGVDDSDFVQGGA